MSHYNEKARWALDYKRVPHVRRATVPGVHQAVARRVSGGRTFPILELDGEVFGESAAILEALERLVPEPALYPADPELRSEALALEAEFDESLAPAIRHCLYQEALDDREFTAKILAVGGPPSRETFLAIAAPAFIPALRRNFAVPDRGDPRPRAIVREHVARIGELAAPTGFLVGDRFSVADLTACSFLIPFVDAGAMPAAMPPLIEPLAEFGRELAATPGGQWVAETYGRFRAGP